MQTLRNIIKFPAYLFLQTIFIVMTPVLMIMCCFSATPAYREPETFRQYLGHLKNALILPYELFYN